MINLVDVKRTLLIVLLFCSLQGFGQQQDIKGPEDTKVEMADQMRTSGKIYVVVAVLSTVLIGMLSYAVILDRRISKLERESAESK